MEEKAKNTPKKSWEPMEMAKVPLDPQQAVLTCCVRPERLQAYSWGQCIIETCGSEPANHAAS